MKAITTRFIGPNDNQPARIRASDSDGNSFTLPVPITTTEDNHKSAAVSLCHKMGWHGWDTLIGGAIKGGMVWVFPPLK